MEGGREGRMERDEGRDGGREGFDMMREMG